jgi:hypothetical protein
MMWITGHNYKAEVVDVFLSPTQWEYLTYPFTFHSANPQPYTINGATAPYPSSVITINGAGVAWNTHTITASANPNIVVTVGAYPAWLAAPNTPCSSATLIPGNKIEETPARTYSIQIGALGFLNDHPLHVYSTKTPIDQPDGSAYNWDRAGINLPAAYSQNGTVDIALRVETSPAFSGTTFQVGSLRVKHGDSVIGGPWPLELTASNQRITPGSLNIVGLGVRKETYTFTYEILGFDNTWRSIGQSGPHKIYWTANSPINPPFRKPGGVAFGALYDAALEKVCGYANGLTLGADVAAAVSSGIANEIVYNPAFALNLLDHPLEAYSAACLCADHSYLGEGLMRSVGFDAATQFLFTGATARFRAIWKTANGRECTAQYQRPSVDGVVANPHFYYHAVFYVHSAGRLYDPSYGDSYATWAALEKVPGHNSYIVGNLAQIAIYSYNCAHIQ